MKRVQMRRGVKLPPGTKYVGRPTRWGNRHRIGAMAEIDTCPSDRHPVCTTLDREDAVALFRVEAKVRARFDPTWLAPLRGFDLACWCAVDEPCHVDVLHELLEASA